MSNVIILLLFGINLVLWSKQRKKCMVDGCLLMMVGDDDDGTTFSKYTWCWKGFCLLSSALVVFHKHDNGPGRK